MSYVMLRYIRSAECITGSNHCADLQRSRSLLRLLAVVTLVASGLQAFGYGNTYAAAVLFAAALVYFSLCRALKPTNRAAIMRGITLLTSLLVVATAMLAGEILVVGIYIPLIIWVTIEESDPRVARWCINFLLVIIPLQIYLFRDITESQEPWHQYTRGMIDVLYAVWSGGYLFKYFLHLSRSAYGRRKAALVELNESVNLIREANTEIEERHYANRCARRSIEQSIRNACLTRAQLEASNEQLEQFAYAASHDLKEPVRTIRSFMQMARRKLSPDLQADTDLIANFEFVENNALAMHTLLERLLVYSRSGRVEACAKTIDLRRACQRAVVMAPGDAETKNALVAALNEQPFIEVQVDPQGLQTALQEVLANAFNFVAPGEAPEIAITLTSEADRAVCRISDRGIGIEPAYQEQVFGLFKRLHPREVYPGAGIGLTLARRSIERSGGEIWLTSESGVGTSVCIALPIMVEVAL